MLLGGRWQGQVTGACNRIGIRGKGTGRVCGQALTDGGHGRLCLGVPCHSVSVSVHLQSFDCICPFSV